MQQSFTATLFHLNLIKCAERFSCFENIISDVSICINIQNVLVEHTKRTYKSYQGGGGLQVGG